MIRLWISGAVALGLAGCATNRAPPQPEEPAMTDVSADLLDANGRALARASATQSGPDVRLRIEALAMASGAYGAHVHSVGRCDPPTFTSAGPHWNPSDRQHGKDNPQGMHRGDLPNLLVGTDGRGSFEYTIPVARIDGGPFSLLDGDGAAVVIHAQPDDYRTDPSGNSGARIACGVLR